MPLEIADKVVLLKQVWTHVDVEELGETETTVIFHCLNCNHIFTVFLGD